MTDTLLKTTHEKMMDSIQENCFVDTSIPIEYPPVALSFGEKLIKNPKGDSLLPIPLGTYGNFSCVSAPPKTKKTFFQKSIMNLCWKEMHQRLC